jgi:CubicO group peptidase (beta-lactamase class C family)
MWITPLLALLLEPGSAFLLLRDGKPVETRVEGTADIRTGRPITARTNFRLASVSKQFTATAILLLARDGRLTLDDAASRHLPAWPAYAQAVTIRHLLTHTSGLPDYDDGVPDATPQLSDADVYAFVQRQSALLFAPGSRYRYSNTAYALLALIVEHASGQPFPAFLKARIFRPLGMKRTLAYTRTGPPVPARAYGHSRSGGGWRVDDQSPTSAVLGDGGIYSNLNDLARWVRALERCTLLDCETLNASWTSARLNDGTPVHYGFGWRLETRDGRPVIGHTGETRGFRNALLRFPAERLTVILLTNRNEGNPAASAAAAVTSRLKPQ